VKTGVALLPIVVFRDLLRKYALTLSVLIDFSNQHNPYMLGFWKNKIQDNAVLGLLQGGFSE